jgi:hypothetical protein
VTVEVVAAVVERQSHPSWSNFCIEEIEMNQCVVYLGNVERISIENELLFNFFFRFDGISNYFGHIFDALRLVFILFTEPIVHSCVGLIGFAFQAGNGAQGNVTDEQQACMTNAN